MAANDKTVDTLTSANTLDGSEVLYVIQGSNDRKATVNQVNASNLKITNNLSDLNSVPTARTNLGLGNSSTRNVGTATGTVAAGDDSRIIGALQNSNNLSDVGSQQTALNNITSVSGATSNYVLTKDSTTGNVLWTIPNINPNKHFGLYNCLPTYLKKWRAAVAKVKNGSGRATIMCIGDSTTAGAGAGTGGNTNMNGAALKGYPARLATQLNAYFCPASYNSFISDSASSGAGVALGTYDTRISLGANWSVIGGGNFTTLGGQLIHYTSGAANNLSFTPVGAFDTIKIVYVQNAALGSFTTNVDGGSSLGTTTTSGAAAMQTATFTVAKGTHTINIVPNNNGDLYLTAVITYDSTTPAIDVIQASKWGGVIGDLLTSNNVWSYYTMLDIVLADLYIVDMAINDMANGTNATTWKNNTQTLITKLLSHGDVLLKFPIPSNNAAATNGTATTYLNNLKALADSNNCGMINMKEYWVDFATSNGVGYYFDSLHPSGAGYSDEVDLILRALFIK